MDWNEREKRLVEFELREDLSKAPLVEVFVYDISEAPRGFASLLPETQAAIARKGGRNCQAKGLAHRWSREEAIKAGKKGGDVVAARTRRANR